MLKLNYGFWIVCGAVLLGAGCRTTVNTVETAPPYGSRTIEADKRIVTDGSLDRKVNVLAVNSVFTPNNLLQVQVEVRNLTNRHQEFFYSFEWFDVNGMQVTAAGGGWTQRQIMGRESMMLQSVAPDRACRDFRLKLMEKPR